MKKYIAANQNFKTLDTCEEKKGGYFFDKYEMDDYGIDELGRKIKYYRSQIFSSTETDRMYMEDFKERLTSKIKKPHEIIIFIDGYSFSATSVFIKATYLAGGATVNVTFSPTPG